jgi:hypothetical protein
MMNIHFRFIEAEKEQTVNWRIANFRLDEAQSHVQLPVPTGVRTPNQRGAFCALWN